MPLGRDLEGWKRLISEEERGRIKGWSICLVINYMEDIRGEKEKLTQKLMHYVAAHLRLIVPNTVNADRILRANVRAGKLEPFNVSVHPSPLFLEDWEQMCSEIEITHLQKLRSWMPWIIRFRRRWEILYPLYLSFYFAEMARTESDARVRHVLRVMALESLLSTDKTYGFNALNPRILRLLGPQTDLYAEYRNRDQLFLPPLVLVNVLRDVCQLRNTISHGSAIPSAWLAPNRRSTIGLGRQLNYAEELLEASNSMLNLVWKTIIDGPLQTTFATKNTMEAYFKRKQRKRRP